MSRIIGKKGSYALLALSFASSIMLFQNCERFDLGQTGQSSVSKRFQSENSNGNTYDGKVQIIAPSAASPGDKIEISVIGGKGPYKLDSNLSKKNIEDQSNGNYLLNIPNDFNESVIQLDVTDARNERATGQIAVLGNNRWFFERPVDAQVDQNKNVYLLEASKAKILKLEPNGSMISDWSIPAVSSSPNEIQYGFELVADILYLSLPDKIQVYDLHGSLLGEILDLSGELWAQCGGPGHLAALHGNKLLVLCRNKRTSFMVSENYEVSRFLDFDFFADASAQNSKGEIFISEKGGRLQVYSLAGDHLRTEVVPIINDSRQEGIWSSDLIFDNRDRLIYLNRLLRQVYALDFEGDRFLNYIATSGMEVGDVFHPHSLDVDSFGDIYVTDTANKRMTVFSSGGDYVRHFGSSGSLPGELKEPFEVQVLNNKDIAVLERGNGRISIYDKNHNFIRHIDPTDSGKTWGNPQGMWFNESTDTLLVANRNHHSFDLIHGSRLTRISKGDSSFHHPADVSQAPNGNIYLADFAYNKIQVFDPNGLFLFSFGSDGKEMGATKLPSSIFIKEKMVYVTEIGNQRVQAFALNGHPLQLVYKMPDGEIGLNAPRGIDIDDQGLVYVADSGNHRLVVFNTDGSLKGTFGSFGTGELEFNQPQGITISDNKVYISDSQNHRVQIFKLEEILSNLE